MKKLETYVSDFNNRKEEQFSLELLYPDNSNDDTPSHLVVHCREGVKCDVAEGLDWIIFRTKVFTNAKCGLQIVSDLERDNRTEFTDDGKLTLLLHNLKELSTKDTQDLVLGLERLLTQTLPEYVVA